jgi:hypothetical protein
LGVFPLIILDNLRDLRATGANIRKAWVGAHGSILAHFAAEINARIDQSSVD